MEKTDHFDPVFLRLAKKRRPAALAGRRFTQVPDEGLSRC
jgi:hypothetical protein